MIIIINALTRIGDEAIKKSSKSTIGEKIKFKMLKMTKQVTTNEEGLIKVIIINPHNFNQDLANAYKGTITNDIIKEIPYITLEDYTIEVTPND
jgi:hypothetical protein